MNDCDRCIVKGIGCCAEVNASCKTIRTVCEKSIKKFAEWLQENVCITDGVTIVKDVEYTRVVSFIELLSEYEKEHNK